MNNHNQIFKNQNQSLESQNLDETQSYNENQADNFQNNESSNQIESLRRSVRVKSRIDYKELHKTGVIKELSFDQGAVQENFEANISESNQNQEKTFADVHEISTLLNNFSILSPPPKMADNAAALDSEQSTLIDDILDFIDEKVIESDMSIEEIESHISKIEQMRTKLRRIHKDIEKLTENYETIYAKNFLDTIAKIKIYINNANRIKKEVREIEKYSKSEDNKTVKTEEMNNQIRQSETSKFLMAEVQLDIDELMREFSSKANLKDEEVSDMKKDLKENIRKFDNLSNKIKELYTIIPVWDLDQAESIKQVKEKFQQLAFRKNEFSKFIKEEYSLRELHKEELFKTSNLNIKLPKFRGYDSQIDIYTFQLEFEKVYLRSTPKRMLADVLKNNHLDDPALSLVKAEKDIDEIWKRLKLTYGDAKIMLHKKMKKLQSTTPLFKIKDSENLSDTLSKLISQIKDIMNLADYHKIKEKLYNGEGLEQIYNLIGDNRLIRWLSHVSEEGLSGENEWEKFVEFLEKEMRIHQQKGLIQRKRIMSSNPKDSYKKEPQDKRVTGHRGYLADQINQSTCSFCGETGHIATNGPGSTKIIQYFACEKFTQMTPQARFQELQRKKLCFQCLYPGASSNSGKHKEGHCQRDFTCQHESHNKYSKGKHVLVCQEHSDTDENKSLLEKYKSKCILRQKVDLPQYAKDIKLSFHASYKNQMSSQSKDQKSTDANLDDKAIYILQTIKVNSQQFTIFYDTGCGDMVSKHSAIKRLGNKAKLECKGPIKLGGVGCIQTESPYGIYQIKLPLINGSEATLSGVCLKKITNDFPVYPLQGKVKEDIEKYYQQTGGNPSDLPIVPKTVGGSVDIMIGIKYLRYHPKLKFQLPSGLTIYESMFRNADGSTGVIGGPHKVFTEIDKRFHHCDSNATQLKNFFTEQYQLYQQGYQLNPDINFLHSKCNKDFNITPTPDLYITPDELETDHQISTSMIIRSQKMFEAVENAASEITYRCVNCRNCKDCKINEKTEMTSIREEVEQDIINKSVTVNINDRSCIANLPLLYNPVNYLAPNKCNAVKVYKQQVYKLQKNPKDKDDVIKSEAKLQQLGYVKFLKDLPTQLQKLITEQPVQNYIPWRAVWNKNSISTPCRVVFDASQPTASGYSLNDIVAKGRNNMNKLVEVFIRWQTHKVAIHTDISKMYNTVRLKESDWCLQRYLWDNELDVNKIPQEKLITTLIYGVKSSGNQSEKALREVSKLSSNEYPEVNDIIQKDVYVDDCLTGEQSTNLAMQRADEIEIVLSRGGFSLKGFTFSKQKPLESVSKDQESINVAGMRWYPETDEISLDVTELNFNKKYRGKKASTKNADQIPKQLTRRQCVSKVAEVYDLTGKITPITAMMKHDLHELVQRQLDWDDCIPDELRPIWESHFEMIKEINNIRFNRAVIPDDAVSLDINTINTADASKKIACSAIYVRFKRKLGNYSCQLVFSRSKLIPANMSQPRAELFAATLNAHTSHIVKRSLSKYHRDSVNLTDSQIVLHWLHNKDKQLKLWIRNRVIEINRFTNLESWFYVKSCDMIADIGTRRRSSLKDVSRESEWINGYKWMTLEFKSFPALTIDEIKLNQEEVATMRKEFQGKIIIEQETSQDEVSTSNIHLLCNIKRVPSEVEERYKYSNYVIDPNSHRFTTVIRILALVQRFITNLKHSITISKNNQATETINSSAKNQNVSNSSISANISKEELDKAAQYFFRKGSQEVKHFLKESQYKKISTEKDGTLFYTGRILPTQSISIVGRMTDAMKDLQATTFCVPILEKHSPIAYSIVSEIHWYNQNAKHGGVETVLRYSNSTAYIIEGRELVKRIKRDCERCKILAKRTIEVSMGPISTKNITIAPAFYYTQVDLAGPFKAYTLHNQRKTIKIWMCVFCCTTTTTTSIKIMEDYSAAAFIQAFIRLACEVGYPKKLLPDEGSQLISGCESMKINYNDVKQKLHSSVDVEYETCPTAAHHVHGRVERKIRQIKDSVEKNLCNQRLSVLQWETFAAEISNSINNLPLALGSICSDLDNLDLITPNRLRLGRNNDRSPVGTMEVITTPSRFLRENEKIFNTWFENWLLSHVPKLMFHPKWFNSERDVKTGDVILFLKNDGSFNNTYHYGMIKDVEHSKDDKIRRVTIKYRNFNEDTNRETRRAVRNIVMIHPVDETCIAQELGEMASKAAVTYRLSSRC